MTHDQLVAKVDDLRDLAGQLLEIVQRQRKEIAAWKAILGPRPSMWARFKTFLKGRHHSEEARDGSDS